MTPVLAHVGHWLVELLYVAPVIVIVGWISIRAMLDRRRGEDEDETPSRAPDAQNS